MRLTKEQQKWLDWLRERGGSGYLDRFGRLVAAGETSPQGATVCWLNLVAKGLITGGMDRLAAVPLSVQRCEPTCCSYCEYEEADGSLIEQCALCKAKDAVTPNVKWTA